MAIAATLLAGCGGGGGKSFDRDYAWEKPTVLYRFAASGQAKDGSGVPYNTLPLNDREKQEFVNAYAELHALGAPSFREAQPGETVDIDILKPTGGVPSRNGDKDGLTTVYAPVGTGTLQYVTILVEDNLDERTFRRTAWHEAGHSVGLDHAGDYRSVMYPTNTYVAFSTIQFNNDDKQKLQDLYHP